MKEELSGDDLVAELHLVRSNFEGSLLVLEGETDCRIFDELIDPEACKTIPGHGKESVVEAILGAGRASIGGVLGIVDADFWHLDGESPPSASLLVTDDHDIEMMMIRSPALDRVLRELGSVAKVQRFSATKGVGHLRDFLVSEVAPLGLIGWLNSKEGWALSFEGLKLDKYVDRETLALELDRLIPRILQMNEFRVAEEDMRGGVESLGERGPDPYQVSKGHDVVCLLSVGFRKALGNKRAYECRPDSLEAGLRLAYARRHFRKTALFNSVMQWEGRNAGYKVFQV